MIVQGLQLLTDLQEFKRGTQGGSSALEKKNRGVGELVGILTPRPSFSSKRKLSPVLDDYTYGSSVASGVRHGEYGSGGTRKIKRGISLIAKSEPSFFLLTIRG